MKYHWFSHAVNAFRSGEVVGIGATACLPTLNIYFMHVSEALGLQRPIKGHLADPPGPIISASARTDCSRPDSCVVAASMTTGHHWASLGVFLVHAADKREESLTRAGIPRHKAPQYEQLPSFHSFFRSEGASLFH